MNIDDVYLQVQGRPFLGEQVIKNTTESLLLLFINHYVTTYNAGLKQYSSSSIQKHQNSPCTILHKTQVTRIVGSGHLVFLFDFFFGLHQKAYYIAQAICDYLRNNLLYISTYKLECKQRYVDCSKLMCVESFVRA